MERWSNLLGIFVAAGIVVAVGGGMVATMHEYLGIDQVAGAILVATGFFFIKK